MRLYSDHPGASIRMHDSAALRRLLADTITRHQITHVVETGTNLGLGSTRFVAEAFPPNAPPEVFVTIEARLGNWLQARRNLARFPFVRCEWGLSVPRSVALRQVATDEAISGHDRYPDIFIDDVADPIAFYRREITGGRAGRALAATVLAPWYAGDARLAYWCERMRDAQPLIILDAAGATGWPEFRVTLDTMGDRPYFLLLDDVHHLKHFRSLAVVEREPSFTVLGVDRSEGWALARHG